MIKQLLVVLLFSFVRTHEHWFIFDQYQFPAFETSLFTINTSENKTLSFLFSSFDRRIIIDYNNETIKLNIERADLLPNTIYHTVFIVIRNGNRIETYVNCKLIDSYYFYSSLLNSENTTLTIDQRNQNVQHYEITPTNQLTQQEIFDIFSCKQTNSVQPSTTMIGKPLIRKMQHVIEKVQRRKLRSRRQNDLQTSTAISNSITVVYKPNVDTTNSSRSIFSIPSLNFHINYSPIDRLFSIQFNSVNRTEYILYGDKSTDLIDSSNKSLVVFLHLTPTMISCYVNCELIDQELVSDSIYIENFLDKIISINENERIYNRKSTMILSNRLLEQIAANFFCLRLDQNNQDLLPDKYTLRKFTNTLDILLNTLDTSTTSTDADREQNISTIIVPPINGYGSLKESLTTRPIETATVISSQPINSDRSCSIDTDCNSTVSSMICQSGQCVCPKSFFWSSIFRRCVQCQDISIGDRCFRLSTHKSTWYEANEYCQDEEGDEYTMKFVSNLNQSDIQYLKENYLHNTEDEHVDYVYWIGATSHFNTRKLHESLARTKRQVPTQIFRWYETGETAQLNIPELWCSQIDYASLSTINNNQLCVSLASCGLYADDCQRNYRFICQAV